MGEADFSGAGQRRSPADESDVAYRMVRIPERPARHKGAVREFFSDAVNSGEFE